MCGIVGYIGGERAAPILLDGLSRPEYRGYDSAGPDFWSQAEGMRVVKSKDRSRRRRGRVYDAYLRPVEKERHQVDWEISSAEKGGYEHLMGAKSHFEAPEIETP